ncbi:hypothetical protein SAMN04487926_1539 [Paraburkholderia steynii]|uniref:Uncharacterized protein n=1 Tax=Paraburkholderia steynii TaxID=1245441 RepID=A0A7Z7BKL5_9BURK|nr:hypothetical protein [Paraburkholderia steynii]SDJ46973.1 hypothetical protein SAMN04487926_1539 [Paraburkholderia steynii]
MSYEFDSSTPPEAADLASALSRALAEGHSREWRTASGSTVRQVKPFSAPGLTVLPVVSLKGLEHSVAALLKHLSEPLSGAGLVLLPADVPLSLVDDFIEPLVDYGVSIENASSSNLLKEAEDLTALAEQRWEETRGRWDGKTVERRPTSE